MKSNIKINKNRTMKMTILGAAFITIFAVFIFGCILSKTHKCIAGNNDNKYFTNITIDKGDTLWNLAEEYMDEEHYSSIYEYMDELRDMNNLTSDELYAGQNLIVTYYSTSVASNR